MGTNAPRLRGGSVAATVAGVVAGAGLVPTLDGRRGLALHVEVGLGQALQDFENVAGGTAAATAFASRHTGQQCEEAFGAAPAVGPALRQLPRQLQDFVKVKTTATAWDGNL